VCVCVCVRVEIFASRGCDMLQGPFPDRKADLPTLHFLPSYSSMLQFAVGFVIKPSKSKA